ncbi:MAG: restriction endonuclease [Oscillospiraceae bacterium]|nr:restriction endonuclease [Oscillospiraceae bacterium]
MNLHFEEALAAPYHSGAQKIRVMSENWVAENIYCPCCGNPHIQKLNNNKPVADFQCDYCGSIFELKSKKGSLGKKIADGAYDTMIERITSTQNPHLLLMTYSEKLSVTDMIIIPKFFFVPTVIERRKPLAETARRAGWVGCNIRICDIPAQGKINIITNQRLSNIDEVIHAYKRIAELRTDNIEKRGWLFDVLNCVNSIPTADFSLNEVYAYKDILQEKHLSNHNIEAKIRQQLQILRDAGFIEFLERGHYRKTSV